MISPLRLRTADLASAELAPRESNETALRFVPIRREPRKEKDPGSAFGPESVPLATGLVPVVYWVPGPFPGPTPCPVLDSENLLLIPAMSTVNPTFDYRTMIFNYNL